MYKRIFIAALIGILLLSFAGCRQKSPQDEPGYREVELTYYKVFDDEEAIEPFIKEFEAQHPGLKINYRQFTDFSEYQTMILNEMAEGEGPDILSMQNTWFASNIKKLAPMPVKFGTTKDFEETFVDAAYRDLVHVDEDGMEKIFGMPLSVDSLALYYNKDHFEDRLPSQGKPSLTWEGIKADVTALSKEDNSADRFQVSGIAMGRGDNITRAVDILYLLFLQYGTEFYNGAISKATFATNLSVKNSFPARDALMFFMSFADSDYKYYSWNAFTADANSPEKEVAAFVKGEVSMIIGYSYLYDQLLNQIAVLKRKGDKVIDKDAVRVAPIPQLYDPATSSKKRVAYASYFAEAVSRNSQHPELAWDFLIFLTSKKNQERYFKVTHRPTSRRDLIEEQKKHPIYGIFAAQTGYAESFPLFDYYRYKEIFEQVMFRVGEGEYELDALRDAQDSITSILPKKGVKFERKEQPKTDTN